MNREYGSFNSFSVFSIKVVVSSGVTLPSQQPTETKPHASAAVLTTYRQAHITHYKFYSFHISASHKYLFYKPHVLMYWSLMYSVRSNITPVLVIRYHSLYAVPLIFLL